MRFGNRTCGSMPATVRRPKNTILSDDDSSKAHSLDSKDGKTDRKPVAQQCRSVSQQLMGCIERGHHRTCIASKRIFQAVKAAAVLQQRTGHHRPTKRNSAAKRTISDSAEKSAIRAGKSKGEGSHIKKLHTLSPSFPLPNPKQIKKARVTQEVKDLRPSPLTELSILSSPSPGKKKRRIILPDTIVIR